MHDSNDSKPKTNGGSRDAISPDVSDSTAKDECEHPEGHRVLEFDADGCGYYLWICDSCGYTEFDDMP